MIRFFSVMLPIVVLATAAHSGETADNKKNEGASKVRLHVKASDPNGGKLVFTWKQVEGPSVKIDNPSSVVFDDKTGKWISDTFFIPPQPGTYTFEVIVRNDAGLETKKRFVLEARKGGTE